MAYTRNMSLTAKDFTYEEFEREVKNIENHFPEKACKSLSGQVIWVTTPPFAQLDYFVKTTVSDYHAVYGNININILTRMIGQFNNYTVLRIGEANKKVLRGKIKYIPKNTLMMSMYMVNPNEKEKGWYTNYQTPVLQRESYLTTECDALFANNAPESAYTEVMRNTWLPLEQDKRFRTGRDEEYNKLSVEGTQEISELIQEALCINADLEEMCGVTYVWNNILFIFPINFDQLNYVFKDRDKINGRRRVIASIVKEHKRGNSVVSQHIRSGCEHFSINDRNFSVFIGGDVLRRLLSTKKQKELWKEKIKTFDTEEVDDD